MIEVYVTRRYMKTTAYTCRHKRRNKHKMAT